MTPHRRTTYDRVLDWFTDHRQTIAKAMVVLAVVTMLGTVLVGALSAVV